MLQNPEQVEELQVAGVPFETAEEAAEAQRWLDWQGHVQLPGENHEE